MPGQHTGPAGHQSPSEFDCLGALLRFLPIFRGLP